MEQYLPEIIEQLSRDPLSVSLSLFARMASAKGSYLPEPVRVLRRSITSANLESGGVDSQARNHPTCAVHSRTLVFPQGHVHYRTSAHSHSKPSSLPSGLTNPPFVLPLYGSLPPPSTHSSLNLSSRLKSD